jgi:hypothetical protein
MKDGLHILVYLYNSVFRGTIKSTAVVSVPSSSLSMNKPPRNPSWLGSLYPNHYLCLGSSVRLVDYSSDHCLDETVFLNVNTRGSQIKTLRELQVNNKLHSSLITHGIYNFLQTERLPPWSTNAITPRPMNGRNEQLTSTPQAPPCPH